LRLWVEKERFDGDIVDCLTVILPTRGCSWDSCYMCSYSSDSPRDATQEKILAELFRAVERKSGQIIKIFTSGSFFDSREIEKETRQKIFKKIQEKGFRKIIVESRPEFITEETVKEISLLDVEVEVGIGLETSNDVYRAELINKGFTFQDFVEASKMLREVARVKAYLLLKPPLLTEKESIEDILKSLNDVKRFADIVSLNLMTIHSKTPVESLYLRGLYRPPWLWSAVEILKKSDTEIICDPVAGGKKRGPHNCFRCDRDVVREIREFSLTQKKNVFERECECIERWRLSLNAEQLTGSFIFS